MKTCTNFITCSLTIVFLLCCHFASFGQMDYSQYVNPFIGTGGHGHTYPGATVPFGMVQCSPDTRIDGSWDGCSGYHFSDSVVYGFSHTHLSGTGVSDYGDILVSPLTRAPQFIQEKDADILDKKSEEAKAGYYAVQLKKSKVKVEVTATERSGIQRYTFQNPEQAGLLVDMMHRDKVVEQKMWVVGSNTLEGYRISDAWARRQVVYFVMEFSEPIQWFEINNGSKKQNFTKVADGNDEDFRAEIIEGKVFLKFRASNTGLVVKTAISSVSIEGARKNLQQETSGKNFAGIQEEARQKWNKALSVITVSGAKDEALKIFYTALYHCLIVPNIYSDVDGSFRGMDDKIYNNPQRTRYTVFSLWDTFRAAHPLYNLIAPEQNKDFILSFLDQYKESGRLPVWELSSNETDCMIGYHSVSVITDALVKGTTFSAKEKEELLAAMQHSANRNNEGLQALRKQGFIGIENESESVSKTLEYAYDDWCIARFTEITQGYEKAKPWYKRALHYQELFNPQTNFMQPRFNGGWLPGFEPREVNNHYTEANAWQYSFFVPQDVHGLIALQGGRDKFIQKLDELFSASTATTGRTQSDITGLIGQYAHGNEPSHHMAYLYAMAGAPHKTQEKVRYIMDEFYKNEPDGLIGNEDCGQMSAWLVMSALGIYPVCPGSVEYIMGTPWFANASLQLGNGKTFTFLAPGISQKNFYPSATFLNGERIMRIYLNHEEILKGGELKLAMASQPQMNYQYQDKDLSQYRMPSMKYLRTPIIESLGVSFREKQKLSIRSEEGQNIVFRKITPIQISEWQDYSGEIDVNESMQIEALVHNGKGDSSYVVRANFVKRPNQYTINILSRYNPQYNAGGDEGLLDGIRGAKDWRKGYWQGFQGQNFEAIVDMGSLKKVSEMKAGFLQDQRSWILMPKKVEFWGSVDGKRFELISTANHSIKDNENETILKDFVYEGMPKEYRFIKVVAENYGTLPAWHPGAGGEAFIFIDEIMLR